MRHSINWTFLVLLGALLSCNLDKVDQPADCPSPPIALFTPDKTAGNAPLSVLFGNSSTGAISYTWDFGDGSTTNVTSPTHIFSTAGTYTVKLVAIKGDCKDSSTVNITVNATGPAPVAAFTITNGGCVAPCQVIFTNSSIDATSFEWDFGDGSAKSTQLNPTHTYNLPGDYLVSLTATNAGGGVDSETKTLFVDAIKFEKTFGGTLADRGAGILQNADGTFVVIGTKTLAIGAEAVYVLKLDKFGTKLWEQTHGTSNYNAGWDILSVSGNTYMAVGSWSNPTSGEDVVLMNLNGFGGLTWPKYFGGNNQDIGIRIKATPDGGYIIMGITDSEGAGETDIYLIKTFADGTLDWKQTYGGAQNDIALGLTLTADGGYAMAGVSYGLDISTTNAYFVKTDPTGAVVVQKKIPGTYWATGVLQTADGGYLLSVSVIDNNFESDTKLMKLDNAGNTSWEKPVVSGAGSEEAYLSVAMNDGYVFGGYTSSTGAGGKDGLLVKTDLDGNFLWSKTYGGALNDEINEVIPTADGGFIMVGLTGSSGAGGSDVFVLKTDKNGNSQ